MESKAATRQRRDSKASPNGTKASAPAELNKEEMHKLLYHMLLGRRFEEKTAEAYALGKIGGFCHLYIGQEALGVGAISALRPDDYVISAYREHVQALVKGMSPRAVMAELYGRATGCSKGKGGSMHLFSAEHNFMGGWGIVGGQIRCNPYSPIVPSARRDAIHDEGTVAPGRLRDGTRIAPPRASRKRTPRCSPVSAAEKWRRCKYR